MALIATAAVEIGVFVLIAHAIGVAWAVLALVATSVLGGWLLGREGIRGARGFRAALREGRPPGRAATDGLLGLVAALLLVLPGFVTDAIGLTLLLPPVRAGARGGMRRVAERWMPGTLAGDLFGPRQVPTRRSPTKRPKGESGDGGDVIEGEIIDRDR